MLKSERAHSAFCSSLPLLNSVSIDLCVQIICSFWQPKLMENLPLQRSTSPLWLKLQKTQQIVQSKQQLTQSSDDRKDCGSEVAMTEGGVLRLRGRGGRYWERRGSGAVGDLPVRHCGLDPQSFSVLLALTFSIENSPKDS